MSLRDFMIRIEYLVSGIRISSYLIPDTSYVADEVGHQC